MKKKTVATFLQHIEASKRRIAKERDDLRELIAEYECIADECGEAVDDLERVADLLSRYL